MSDKCKEYATKVVALEQSKAVDKALGYPRPPVHVGANIARLVPATYAPGAVGWTATECQVVEADDGTALLVLTDAAVALGKRDVVVDGKTVKLDLTVGVLTTRPLKFKPKDD